MDGGNTLILNWRRSRQFKIRKGGGVRFPGAAVCSLTLANLTPGYLLSPLRGWCISRFLSYINVDRSRKVENQAEGPIDLINSKAHIEEVFQLVTAFNSTLMASGCGLHSWPA